MLWGQVLKAGEEFSLIPCGFVLLGKCCEAGEIVVLTNGKRKTKVEIRGDIYPGRTARDAIATMLG